MVYNYTKPRGPIAAMYNSPGPCYQLPPLVGYPDHDTRSTHVREPQWSLGIKHKQETVDNSPGPCYNPDSKILNTGKAFSPQFSLSSRQKEAEKSVTPGPGAYVPEKSDPQVFPKHPAYSLSSRHKGLRFDDIPGPNMYTVDPMLGRTVRSQKASAPSYSISGRRKRSTSCETPGAGAYKITAMNVYKEAPPAYSLSARTQLPHDAVRKPGPGAYSPETVVVNRRIAPKFSFGIRHSPYKGEFMTNSYPEDE
ncbi:Outer dense fiber protein 3 [Clonorchis sinensis]|uniref:Outer dense fiber protein 3 n=2 Tax=Clonorchis sinensis TaxID=79923 RepID=A0A3R7JSC0_CLOSI|nr:Outer dense fiber protein 3 [Clonorchis sinensis]